MRKQWFQKHGQVPGNPGKAEESGFRKLRKNIRIRLKETGRRKSCRGQDHLGSSGSRIPGSSGRLPPWTWPIQFSAGFLPWASLLLFHCQLVPPPPTLYSPSFFTVAAGPLILPPLNRSVLLAPHGPISTSSLLLLHILYNLSLQTSTVLNSNSQEILDLLLDPVPPCLERPFLSEYLVGCYQPIDFDCPCVRDPAG